MTLRVVRGSVWITHVIAVKMSASTLASRSACRGLPRPGGWIGRDLTALRPPTGRLRCRRLHRDFGHPPGAMCSACRRVSMPPARPALTDVVAARSSRCVRRCEMASCGPRTTGRTRSAAVGVGARSTRPTACCAFERFRRSGLCAGLSEALSQLPVPLQGARRVHVGPVTLREQPCRRRARAKPIEVEVWPRRPPHA